MKNNIRKLIALAMVLAMLLSMSAFAAKETASSSFKLPEVLKRETEVPAEEETPAEEPEVPEAEEPAVVIGTAYVVLEQADSTLNIRAAATTESERLGALNHGDAVSVIGYEGEWTIIKLGDAFGYVKSSYLAEEPEAPVKKEPVKKVVQETDETVIETPVTVGDADVRLEGDGMSEIFATIPDGTALVVLGVEGDWVKVEIDGQVGYIYKDSILGVEFEEPEGPEDPEAEPEKKVTIFSSRRSVMELGETVYLTSKLEGFEGCEIRYQWECDKGMGFENVEGATEATYSFEASVETLSYDWRLTVLYR